LLRAEVHRGAREAHSGDKVACARRAPAPCRHTHTPRPRHRPDGRPCWPPAPTARVSPGTATSARPGS